MAAGGLDGQLLPAAAVRCALAMQRAAAELAHAQQQAGEPVFTWRIGLNTGPVVAGVAGLKKFAYDIWGDTGNLAARMEQSGETGRVNISQATHAWVAEEFVCTARGKVAAKNKDEIEMYFVERETALVGA